MVLVLRSWFTHRRGTYPGGQDRRLFPLRSTRGAQTSRATARSRAVGLCCRGWITFRIPIPNEIVLSGVFGPRKKNRGRQRLSVAKFSGSLLSEAGGYNSFNGRGRSRHLFGALPVPAVAARVVGRGDLERPPLPSSNSPCTQLRPHNSMYAWR